VLEQDGLAAAAPPDDNHDLGGRDVQVEPAQHRLIAERLVQLLHADHGKRDPRT
jgi:hypothetical protein